MREQQNRQGKETNTDQNSPPVVNSVEPQTSQPPHSDRTLTVVKDQTEDARVHQRSAEDPVNNPHASSPDAVSVSNLLTILFTAILAGTSIISAVITIGSLML
jgi:hypothetical protein